jgi:hypothetical protein
VPFELPETVSAYGRTSVVMVQDLADPAAPTLTEINATTSVNVSCFLYADAVGTVTTNKVQAPRKICSRSQFEQRGTSTVSVGDLSYSHHPQLPLADAANEAKAALVDGTRWFMVVRSGIDGDEVLEVGDYVDVWQVELLNQNRAKTGDDEAGEFNILQPVIAKADPIYDVQLVA